MGDAADDMYEQAMKQERFHDMLLEICPKTQKGACKWVREDEFGMLECLTCGEVIDE